MALTFGDSCSLEEEGRRRRWKSRVCVSKAEGRGGGGGYVFNDSISPMMITTMKSTHESVAFKQCG